MEIVVVGRNTEISDRFRDHVEEKLEKVEQLAPLAQRLDVELNHEKNPRLADRAERIELTLRGKGPVVRAEAAADDRFGALDLAMDKLAERLRRARDRRKDHRNHTVVPPVDVFVATRRTVVSGYFSAGVPAGGRPMADSSSMSLLRAMLTSSSTIVTSASPRETCVTPPSMPATSTVLRTMPCEPGML